MKTLKEKFEKIANKYIKDFVKKHGYEFDFWISDEVGGIASFCEQYYFNLDDIRYDIDNDLEKSLIFRWQEDGTDYSLKNDSNVTHINLKSYVMGLRYEDLKKEEDKSFEKDANAFKEAIKEYNSSKENSFKEEFDKVFGFLKDNTIVIDLVKGKTYLKKDESKD